MWTPLGHYERVRAVAATARLMAVGGVRAAAASEITIYEHGGKRVLALSVPSHVLGLAFSAAGDRVLAACLDGALRVYAADEDKLVREIAAHKGMCTALCLDAGGEHVFTAGEDGVLRRWVVQSGKAAGEWALSGQPLRAVAVDDSGEYVAAAGDDGVVRAMTLADGSKREMNGEGGAIYALAFTRADGRLAAAGEDGVIRLWFLTGAVEHEARGGGDVGHAGAVRALCVPKLGAKHAQAGEEGPGERLISAGSDGKIKIWRLADKRKPRTLDVPRHTNKAVHGLCFAPPPSSGAAKNSLGAIVAGGDGRVAWRQPLDLEWGDIEDKAVQCPDNFQVLRDLLAATRGKAARQEALAALCQPEVYAEDEALSLLTDHLGREGESELRAFIAGEMGKLGRRSARPALRQVLDDDAPTVRRTALAALRTLDGETSLVPLRAALGCHHADMRQEALRALAPLRSRSPLVPGLIAGRLTDGEPWVRQVALEQLVSLYPARSPEPLRLAYERGPADIKVEVLVRAAMAGLISEGPADMAPLLARALDDQDAGVRRTAFAVRVLERRALAALLLERDESFARAALDVLRRAIRLARPDVDEKELPKDLGDAEVKAARSRLPGSGKAGDKLGEDDLQPLLTAMACRNPYTALAGAAALARLGDVRALGALLQLSREGAADLRREAATALRELHDARARQRLLWMLDDGDAAVRAAALDSYATLAGEGTPLVVAEAALRSAHEDIRVRGLDRLVKLQAKKDRTAQAEALLADALEDEAAKVRGEALRTLWAWHDKDPQATIERALKARFPDIRTRAVAELETLGKDAESPPLAGEGSSRSERAGSALSAWARDLLLKAIADRDATVALAAHAAAVKLFGKQDPRPHVAAMPSTQASVRAAAAEGCARVAKWAVTEVRPALQKLLEDTDQAVRTAALESLDKLLPEEAGPHYSALQGSHLDLRVRAAELLAVRRDERLIEAMRDLLTDKELCKRIPPNILVPLRQRAATALASLGSPRTLKFFATELLKDEDTQVREQAARGMANAARPGDEGYLLDALGHAEVWVRSWAADGLARLGDARALPVLTGTLRHEHVPIRLASIMSLAALGPEGYGGMLQGLEDPHREVQEIIFAIVLARDLRALRAGAPPDLLVSALSSQRPDVRFAAALALELRGDPEEYLDHVIQALLPPRPEKAADMKDWPAEEARGRMLFGLAEALAGDSPELRYAAAQVLRLRYKPLEYFREAQRLGKPRSANAAVVADNAPRNTSEGDTRPQKGWLRRLFNSLAGGARPAGQAADFPATGEAERAQLRRLAFGAYVGLLRQAAPGDDEGHRVRRDAVDRIVELATGGLGTQAAVPALLRALEDPHHLVRLAAFAGLKKLFPAGSEEPLALALSSSAVDVGRAALDQIAENGNRAAARQRLAAALSSPLAEVRKYAFELLERLSDKGSLEPLLAALSSDYADLRIGVIERLATQRDERVTAALHKAMESDHDDLRLRAAELLAERKDDQAGDVLAAFLRIDDKGQVARARAALLRLGSAAAVRVLAARAEEAEGTAEERAAVVLEVARALGQARHPDGVEVLAGYLSDDKAEVRAAAFDAAMEIVTPQWPGKPHEERRKGRDHALALRLLSAAARSTDAAIRLRAANELDAGDLAGANDLLLGLMRDRDAEVRVAAVEKYARRVIDKGAPVAPLEDVVRAGTRELLLPAAEAVAHKGNALALRPLLLFVRAGEEGERERALLALGTLGDARALDELESVAAGGTPEAPIEEASMKAAALEALGRISGKLKDAEARQRVIDKVEEAASGGNDSSEIQKGAVRGLRWIGACAGLAERARSRLEGLLLDRRSTDEDVREAAAQELGKLGEAAAEGALAQALDDWSDEVRTAARKALEKLFPNERTRVEFLAVGSQHDEIAQPAAAYLAREGDAALLVPRLGTLKDDELRQRLRYGLLRREQVPVAALVTLCQDASPSARQEAARLIAARAPDVSEADQRALGTAVVNAERRAASGRAQAQERPGATDGQEAREAEELAWSLALRAGAALAHPPKELLAQARALVPGDAPVAIRRAVLALLQRHGSAADRDLLIAALKDADPEVRRDAAAALAAWVDAREAGALAQRLLLQGRPFDPVALSPVAPALAKKADVELLRSAEARRLLLPELVLSHKAAPLLDLARLDGKADKTLRLDAIAALGRTGGAEAVALLKQIAFDKKGADEAVRKAAFRAYKRAQRQADKARKFEARA